ncbi:MAG: hypothetical protein PUC50_14520 [Bacteroidales bacterium]|nr:hypothetical protein [Bacteroidales bacterium]
MKTIKNILAALMLITFAATFSACEEDSPETIHSVSELSGTWSWITLLPNNGIGDCEVTISTINNTIVIQNFQKQKGSITAEVKGDNFDFEGSIADGAYIITEGHGTILSNWTMIKLSYTITDGNITDKITAELTKTSVTAKKK